MSHYNSITKPRDLFLLSLLKRLTIDFPSHFILSLIDVYKDTATRDKLIFPFAITRILCHFSVSYPKSPYFFVICDINAATIRQSEAQLQPKRPRIETAPPLASSASSISTPSSTGSVTLEAIMAQLERIGAHLNTLSDELCKVNTRVCRIARRQAVMGGFTASPSASPQTLGDEGDDDGSSNADANKDDGASSSGDEEMTAFQ